MGDVTLLSARQEWRRNWKIPIVSALAYALAHSHLFTFGVLMPGIEDETGWSRSQISAGLTVSLMMLVGLSPFLGRFTDRLGSRPIALLGIIIYCLALASFSFVGDSIWHWWSVWLALSLGYVMVATPVWASAVVALFAKSRGLAIAVALCGSGLASATMPVIADILQSRVGWRGTYLGIGLGGGTSIFILLWLFFRPAGKQRMVARPVTDRAPNPVAGATSFRNALLSWNFIRLALSGFLASLVVMSFMVHFIPILLESGIRASAAARIASVIGFSAILGRIVGGLVLDLVRANLVGLVVFSLPALSGIIMLTVPGVGPAVLCAVLIGLALGAEYDVLAYATSRYFDLPLYGRLYGIIFAMSCLGGAPGPLIGGLIYDLFGDYRYMFLMIIALTVLNAALISSLGPYPGKSKKSPDSN